MCYLNKAENFGDGFGEYDRNAQNQDQNDDEDDDQNDDEDEADINTVLGKTFLNWFTAPGLSTIKDESSPTHWTYDDQSHWVSPVFPMCGGTRQSPIDIPADVTPVIRAPCLIWSNYHSAQRYLTLENNGHSIYASSTWAQGGIPILSGGILTGNYIFDAVHWHWGRDNNDGSEHSFQSHKYPLEMHLVHYNSQYPSISAALASNDPQALAVVGVMFKASIFSNPGMTVLTQAMRRATSAGVQNMVLPLGHLGLNFKDGYYTYLGSLTSPPCNQVVRWIILKKPLHIKSSQLNIFRSILVNGRPLTYNYRNIQPLNGRQVQYYDQCQ
ncbi:carbonic anhydrase 2-like [Arctopsyche grandis]|uniref:carbonic anhydrase 2-like n=1 Tax=Arctopsyche grandis TaxID=121162 RepID=UPI00406D7B5D